MYHLIKSITTIDNHTFLAVFRDGIEKTYDIRQLYSDYPQFKILEENNSIFKQVRISGSAGYAIYWNDDLDLSSEEIWASGISTGIKHPLSDMEQLAVNLTYARASVNMTQRELGQATGIYQGDISDIETGKANPSVKTLSRLAEGMGMRLKIEFVQKN